MAVGLGSWSRLETLEFGKLLYIGRSTGESGGLLPMLAWPCTRDRRLSHCRRRLTTSAFASLSARVSASISIDSMAGI